jgi:pyrroline-5-carboxylate reductase
MTVDVAMIGGGNMGAALLEGMIASGSFPPDRLAVVEVAADRRRELAERFADLAVHETVPPCASAVLAVKPGDASEAATAAAAAGAVRLLSIAAGVRLAVLEAAVGPGVAVVRAMPNTPALVGHGASAIAAGTRATADDLDWAASILGAVGTVDRLPEHLLDAFTGVAGSGPAYVFLLAEALTDAAVAEGLSRATAEAVVAQLLLGSATLLAHHGDAPRLRAMVTSPGGTTAAGLRELEERGVRAAVASAVRAATERSRELG